MAEGVPGRWELPSGCEAWPGHGAPALALALTLAPQLELAVRGRLLASCHIGDESPLMPELLDAPRWARMAGEELPSILETVDGCFHGASAEDDVGMLAASLVVGASCPEADTDGACICIRFIVRAFTNLRVPGGAGEPPPEASDMEEGGVLSWL